MKVIIASLLLCSFVLVKGDEVQCSSKKAEITTNPDWTDMFPTCIKAMRQQIRKELDASMQYLAMGAHFARDVKNRPGFAHLFFESASEERQHAIKLIEYLLMRGELADIRDLLETYPNVAKTSWGNGLEALNDALQREAEVTESIKGVIRTCEKGPNDFHLVDYLTGDFLEEQYRGQRDLAGKISTLNKFMDKHGALGEFLFDKKLLA